MALAVSFILGVDSFCCVAISHTCAQLSILQKEVLELGDSSNLSENSVKQIIQKHNEQIK